MAAKANPVVKVVPKEPQVMETHRVFCEAVNKGGPEFWQNLIALEGQRCRTTWDGMTPDRLAAVRVDLAAYCAAVAAYREGLRASQ